MVTAEELSSPQAHDALHRLRAQAPVSWVDAIDGWLVTGRDAAVRVLRDAATFTVGDPRFSTGVVVGTSMLSTDGAEHQRHRAPFASGFTARSAADFASRLDELVADVVDDVASFGSAELRTELAGPLAVRVIADVIDLAGATPDDVLGWYRSIVDGVNDVTMGRPVSGATTSSFADLGRAVRATVTAGSTLLGEPAAQLSEPEVIANTAVLLFGAIETSEGMTANALWHLLSVPGVAEAVRSEPALVDRLVEESLRLEPAAAVVDRYATEAVTFDGAAIERGDLVRVSLAGANRDPDHFEEPDRVALDRPNANRHLTFVVGPHACLGVHLARAQTASVIRRLLAVAPGLQLDADRSEAPTGLIFRKPERLTATW